MSIYVLAAALLVVAWWLHKTADREAGRSADRAISRGTVVSRDALVAELTHRLRVSAVGAAIGTGVGTVMLVGGMKTSTDGGPNVIADLALLLSTTVVASVLAEAVNVFRRMPDAPSGQRTASLEPRTAHHNAMERGGEIALLVLALGTAVVAGVALSRGIDGVQGAVAAAVGALVVIGVCIMTRTQMVRRGVAASDRESLAVDTVASAASASRFSENLVASGGVLTLCSLLVPALTAGPGGLRTIAILGGFATMAVIAVLVLAQRAGTKAAA